jgi:hypothetical protein
MMKGLARRAAAAIVLVLGAGEAGAAVKDTNGNQLYADCTGDLVGQAVCVGYVRGVYDRDRWSDASSYICAVDGVTTGQLVDVVVQYLKAHPEKRDFRAGGLVLFALRDAWPCPKPSTAGRR